MYESEAGAITIALSGDALITRPLMPFEEEAFLGLRELLNRADVGFTNGEVLFHDYEHPPGYPCGMYVRCDPRLIKDLQWFGINMLSCANNHAYDYGEGGVLTNIRNLDEAGLVHAGSGANLAAALTPGYLDTARGRVGLVCATTSAPANSRAGDQRRDLQGRPGVNLIRWTTEWRVDAASFATLQQVAKAFGWSQNTPAWLRAYDDAAPTSEQAVYFEDRNVLGAISVFSEDTAARFVLGSGFERVTRLHTEDMRRNLQAVTEARRMADWVIFSVHNHEYGESRDEPAAHIQALAHAVIDAGADVVVGHGPHRDRGIEIYKGKPIFYSLGAFITQTHTTSKQPHDVLQMFGLNHESSVAELFELRGRAYAQPGPDWWGVIPVVEFEDRRLRRLTLHPIELGFGQPRSQSGRPMLANGTYAEQALERVQRLSVPFGTTVDIQKGLGVVSMD